jgi:probable phosphoglycerate mutase
MADLRHILILRHGVTDSNAGGIVQGQLPVPLNAEGRRQAQALARGLRGWTPPIEVLVSSDLRRTMESAEPIAEALRLPINTDRNWRERCLGVLEGKVVGAQGIWDAATGVATPEGAETLAEFEARVLRAFQSVLHRRERVIAVMTHGGCCRAIVRMMTDGRIPVAEPDRPTEPETIPNCSVMELTIYGTGDQARVRVACFNRTFEMDEAARAVRESDNI